MKNDTSSSGITHSQLLEYHSTRSKRIQALDFRGKISISSKEINQQTDFESGIFHSDSLVLFVNGPFGIKFVQLQSNKNNFVIVDAIQGEVYEGIPNENLFAKVVRIPLSFQMITALLRGEVPEGFTDLQPFRSTQTGTLAYIRDKDSVAERILFDKTTGDLLEFQQLNKRLNTTTVLVRFSDFTPISGISMPLKVAISSGENSAILNSSEIKVNEPRTSYKITVPSSLPRKKL